MFGASPETLQQYKLEPVKKATDLANYEYLKSSTGTYEVKDEVSGQYLINDKEEYKVVCESFKSLKFGDYTDCVWRIVAAILLLGNHVWDDTKYDPNKGIGCFFTN